MAPTLDFLVQQALELPEKQRAELAYRLLDSVEGEEPVNGEWEAEILRRIEDFDAGKIEAIPAETVLMQMREKYPDA